MMRREFLDHVLFWNADDLERKLDDFQAYHNAARSHASLEGHTPLTFAGGHVIARAQLNNVRWVSHCRDLVQLPVAACGSFLKSSTSDTTNIVVSWSVSTDVPVLKPPS